MKYCANCGNTLDENTNTCINCGKLVNNYENINKKDKIYNIETVKNNITTTKKGMPIWLFIIIILVIIFVCIGVGIFVMCGNFFTNITTNNSYTEIEDILNNKKVEIIGSIGETINNDTWKFTLNEVKYYNEIDGYVSNASVEGKGYLVFFFEIENIGSKEEAINNIDFSGIEDKYIKTPIILLDNLDGYTSINGNISVREKEKIYTAFEVYDDWQNFNVSYKNLTSNDSDLMFKITSEQIKK